MEPGRADGLRAAGPVHLAVHEGQRHLHRVLLPRQAAAAGLTPRVLPEGVTYEEASETFVCKKIYMAPMAYEDVPPYAQKIYQNGIEPHWIFMGEVMAHLSV